MLFCDLWICLERKLKKEEERNDIPRKGQTGNLWIWLLWMSMVTPWFFS